MAKTRGHGEGEVKELPNGKFRWRVRVRDNDGNGTRPSGTVASRSDARRAIRKALDAAENDQRSDVRTLTLSQIVEDHIAQKRAQWSYRTTVNNTDLYERHIKGKIGHLRAAGIEPLRLTAYFVSLQAAGLGYSGQHQIASLLSGAYKWAMTRDLLRINPVLHAKPRRSSVQEAKHMNKRAKAMSKEQAQRFYEEAKQDPWGWVLVVMLFTGIRIGEALGLRWTDVEFHADGTALLDISKTRSEHRGKAYENEPKSDKSIRKVLVPAAGTEVLRWRQARAQVEADSVGERPSDYVFSSVRPAGRGHPRLQPLRQDSVRGIMARICQQAGLPPFSPHALRHTWATLLVDQGERVDVVSLALGHAEDTTTRRFYIHAPTAKAQNLTLNLSHDQQTVDRGADEAAAQT